MKKYLLLLAILAAGLIGLAPKPANAQTLYQCYQEKGLAWSGVSTRAKLAAENGVFYYKGTAAQNTKLAGILCSDQLGFSVATGYQRTLRLGASASQDYFYVSSLLLKDGTTLNINSLGGKVFLDIEPGATKEEIVMCTGIDATSTKFTGCTRGLAFSGTSTAAVSGLGKTHNAASVVVMSNVHYIYEQFVDVNNKDQSIDGNKTLIGIWNFSNYLPRSTTTAPTLNSELVTLGYLTTVSTTGCANASTGVRGCVQEATNAQVEAGTATGSTGSRLYLTPNQWLEYADTHFSNNLPVGENVTAFNVLYISSTGSYYIAHATSQSEINKISGVTFETVTATNYPRVYKKGSVIYGTSGMTTGSLVYLSDSGTASTTPGTIRKVIGRALGTNVWDFDPMSEQTQINPPSSSQYTIPLVDASTTLRGWSGAFGGDGTDGILNITSGTTTISLGGANIVVKQYNSINISAGAALTFSNPAIDGTYIILKSRTNCVIAGSINASGMGAATSTRGYGYLENAQAYNAAVSNTSAEYGNTAIKLWQGKFATVVGSGGGGPTATSTSLGGGSVRIECADGLNFTGTINVSGKDGLAGVNATNGSNSSAGEAGGGGGSFLGLYNRLIANSGSINFAGGRGGKGGDAFCSSGGGAAQNDGSSGATGGGSFLGAGGTGGGLEATHSGSACNTCSAGTGGAGGSSNGANGSAGSGSSYGACGAGAFYLRSPSGGGGAGHGGFGNWFQNYWLN